MILESIVTTRDESGAINLTPMGPEVDRELKRFTLKPFADSKTCANLSAHPIAVVHVCEDVSLFARSALNDLSEDEVASLCVEAEHGSARLRRCHRYFVLAVDRVFEDELRPRFVMQVLCSGEVDPCFGFNRARFAVLEATILMTRRHLISRDDIVAEFDRLQVLIDKTGSDIEHETINWMRAKLDA
ncbi:MAG: DUF447 domain-containing protein [Planctomycetota bacterium]